MAEASDETQPNRADEPLPSATPSPADVQLHDIQVVNQQLLLAGLREQTLAEQLRRQLAFTTAITTSLSEGVIVIDTTGQCTFINSAAERMLGWTEAEVVGQHVHASLSMLTANGASSVWEESVLWEVIHSGTSYQNSDITMTRRDGKSFPASYSAAPMIIDAQVVGVAVSFRDMTELHQLHQIQQAYIALLAREQVLLEEQVRQRTHELEHLNIALQAEIDERKRMELARQQLLQQLETVQEAERRRISRELHDQLGQNTTALKLGLDAFERETRGNTALKTSLAQLQALALQIDQDIHTLAVQLRPTSLDDLGLREALDDYVQEWSTRALVPVEFYTTGLDTTRLPPVVETTIYRVVQEALTNILRHAQATNVSLLIHRQSESVRLIVEDDGVGFDLETNRQQALAEHRIGLLGMEERIVHVNGSLTIESTPGHGTTLLVTLPLSPV